MYYYANSLPVGGVAMHVVGADGAHAVTDTLGEYGLAMPWGSCRLEPIKLGDSFPAISSLDAAYALQAAVKLRTLDPDQRLACDVTGNGVVTSLDAARILQRRVGIIDSLPAADLCGSDWAFVPAPATVPNQSMTNPGFVAGPVCRPGAIDYEPLTAPAGGQDFRAIAFGDCTGDWRSTQGVGADGTARRALRPRRVRLRRAGSEMRLLLFDTLSAPVIALDARVTYDASRLRVLAVEKLPAAGDALLVANLARSGEVRIAAASATAMGGRGRALALVRFVERDGPVARGPMSVTVERE